MASIVRENHSSPGIYTKETIIPTYNTRSLGATTLGLVGETLIGPAFQPIPISNYNEFRTYFGGQNPEKFSNGYPKYELPYIAKSYLQQSQQLYVTRVLGLSGYQYNGLWALYVSGSTGQTINEIESGTVFAVLRSKAKYDDEGEVIEYSVSGITATGLNTVTGSSEEFTIIAHVTNGSPVEYKVTLNPERTDYILRVLGTSHKSGTSKIFVEEMYEGVIEKITQSTTTFISGAEIKITEPATGITTNNSYLTPFSFAKTPWFVSEIKGSEIIPLFRFTTISDGNNANGLYKVSIINFNKTTLKFGVQIRAINDTDSKPIVYENHTNCTLNPNDGNNYIGAKIGTVDGLFEQKSKYVTVEIVDDERVKDSVPMGFTGYEVKKISNLKSPKIIYNKNFQISGSTFEKKYYFGLSEKAGIDGDFFNFKGVYKNSNIELTNGFHIESAAAGIDSLTVLVNGQPLSCAFETLSTDDGLSNKVANDTDADAKKLKKFTAYFYGGFDGWDIFRTVRTNNNDYTRHQVSVNQYGDPNSDKQFTSYDGNLLELTLGIPNIPVPEIITSDYYAYWAATRTFADPEFVDINIFATTNIYLDKSDTLVSEIVSMLEDERKDAFYILNITDRDSERGDSKYEMKDAGTVVNDLDRTSIDTSYAATYYPWIQYYDQENGTYLFLPPTKDVVRNIAYTDNTSYSWFPPAGLGRGNVDCVKARKSLVLAEEDILYDGRINFIKTFAQDGVKIWGQKTLLSADNALNRIGVRRMMLYLRKSVRRANLPLIFEPNDNTTKTRFLEIVNPILNNVKTNRGISEYKIVIDDSAEAKARHEMNVAIYILPIGALEYINIEFVITPEGFDFSTI